MRVRNGAVERVEVKLGLEDNANERVEIMSGVAPGDTLLVGAALTISPNTPVRIMARDAAATQPAPRG
jgi:hypothetical protein